MFEYFKASPDYENVRIIYLYSKYVLLLYDPGTTRAFSSIKKLRLRVPKKKKRKKTNEK